MNHDIDAIPPFGNPRHEREWLAQESAMRRERLHPHSAGDDARAQRYQLLARALLDQPAAVLPADFAQKLSARVSASARARTPSTALERLLTNALLIVLALSAVTAVVLYGTSWWPAFQVLLPAGAATQWLLALFGCVALNGALGTWAQRHATPA